MGGSRYLGSMSGSHRSEGVTARAPGKVNICFRVGAVHADGAHTIATLYQAVSLYDTVTATRDDGFMLAMLGDAEIPGGERNLAIRAAKLLAQASGYEGGVRLEIEKHIPRGSGMSGGSADAAAALVACNELWGLGLERPDLQRVALELGADVPFALEGGTAVGTGHGDEFSQALSTGTYHWVIVPAVARLREDDVVTRLDQHREKHRRELGEIPQVPTVDTAVLHAVRSGEPGILAEVMQNDLQMATLNVAPKARNVMEQGEAAGALAGVTLATTAGIAFLTENNAHSYDVARQLRQHGQQPIIVEGPVAGAQVVTSSVAQPQGLR